MVEEWIVKNCLSNVYKWNEKEASGNLIWNIAKSGR